MGQELYDNFPSAKAVFKEADEALGFHLSHIIFSGPAEALQLTEHTQPAILTVSVAATRVLLEQLGAEFTPAFAAGHSLGEYSAHVAAGSISFADAVRTVRSRGQFMQQAVPPGEGAMAAILGLTEPQVNDICAQAGDELAGPPISSTPSESGPRRADADYAIVSPANINSPGQIVISGSTDAVNHAIELSKAAGARKTILLKVSAPFHCALMQPAQHQLAGVLEGVIFIDPAFPVACNVDARLISRRADVRDCLIRQVTGPVRWVECVDLLVNGGATHLIEIGPGKGLTGLTRQILGKGVESPVSLNVEDKDSLEATVAALRPS
jgi:[acyl-carrier-protein] S-malonyltransferase